MAPVAALLVMAAMSSGCSSSLKRFEYTEIIMGVDARVTLYAADEPAARTAARAAFDQMNELDYVLSDYREDSEAMRLCRKPGAPVPVSADLADVLARSRAMWEITDGAFDVTIGPVMQLWREARRRGERPPPWDIDEARRRAGWHLVSLDPTQRTVTLGGAGMRLDFGGIGKGYAAQAALAALMERGVERCLVDLGGDIAAGRPPPGTEHWRIAVETGTGSPDLVIPLVGAAVATSGFSAQFVEVRGVRYSHIIDPRTGVGVTNRTAVCVIAPDGATADALASALSVVGREGAAALMARFPDCAAMLEIETNEAPLRIFYNGFPEP